jgi:hypothetical protein
MFALNPEDTRVILIGTSEFEDTNLPSLPAIKDNNVKLRALLGDVVGISKDDVHILEDRDYSNQITSEIKNIASKGLDIIYYAGHGLPHAKQLYLATKKTNLNDPESYGALLADDLLQVIINKGKAKRIIFIFDCCFSGFARENIETKGKEVFLLTATSSVETAKSEAPENDNYTAFTHELLVILEHGIKSTGEILTLQDIFSCLKDRLKSKNLPLPRITSYGSPDELGICQNRAYQNISLTQGISGISPTALLPANKKNTLLGISDKKYKIINDLRPHLPNRKLQERKLDIAIQKHHNKPYPLVCLIHSEDCQSNAEFLDRLIRYYLPTVTQEDGSERFFVDCRFSQNGRCLSENVDDLHQNILNTLGESLLGNRLALRSEIVAHIVNLQSSLILEMSMNTNNWSPCGGLKLIHNIIKFWATFEFPLTHHHLLLICLRFNYTKMEKSNLFKWLRKPLNDQIRAEFKQLENLDYDDFRTQFGVHGVILPELINIEKEDVEAWVRKHLHQVSNMVQPKIDRLFKSSYNTVPMCDLARELGKILEEFPPDVFRI